MRGNTLVINYVDETDNGRYSCQTFNDYDRRGQRAEYMLNVIGRDPSGSIDDSILLSFSSTSTLAHRSDQSESR